MIKNKIAELLKYAVSKAVNAGVLNNLTELKSGVLDGIIIEKTKNPEFGDYACNISYLAREARMAPPKIADEISKYFEKSDEKYFKVTVVNGFINFKLTPIWISETIAEILKTRTEFGKVDIGKNKKVNLEYVSANPTGPLHIGHGRWAALGSSIVNIMKFLGYNVKSEFYINDAGNQIKNMGHSLFLRILQEVDSDVYFPIDKEADARAKNFYPGDYMIDIAKQYIEENPGKAGSFLENSVKEDNLYMPDEQTLEELSNFAKKINLDQQKKLLSKFKTHFDIYYAETELHQSGKVTDILDFLESKGALFEKEGATWFASSKFLDEQDRVIRKSDGALTYLTADIAYHKDKLDRGFEHLINIWGADHHGYVPRMKSAIQAMGYEPDTLEVLIGQMVNLIISGEQVRMGKRKKMVTLEELIDEVGADATRFWMVYRSMDTTLDFDVELAKSASDENPVFYVQYAHARCCSILRTATSEREDSDNKETLPALYTQEKLNSTIDKFKQNPELLNILWQNENEKENQVTKNLVLYLETYKDTVIKAGRDKAPHYIARYLLDLSSCYHSFYNECRVLNLNPAYIIPEELQDARVALIDATRQLLYNGLELLGVNAPESM